MSKRQRAYQDTNSATKKRKLTSNNHRDNEVIEPSPSPPPQLQNKLNNCGFKRRANDNSNDINRPHKKQKLHSNTIKNMPLIYYNNDDVKNEKILKQMLKIDSVLLQDSNKRNKFEVIVNNKSYTVVQGKIGKNGKKRTDYFSSKKNAFDAALRLLVAKMHDDWTIVEEDESESSSSEESEASSSTSSSEEEPGIFDDYSFGLSGSFSKSEPEIKKMIKNADGVIKTKLNEKPDFLLVKNSTNLKSTECLNAKKFNIPIINEQFLFDSIDKNKKLDYKKYIIEPKSQLSNNENSPVDKIIKKLKTLTKNDNFKGVCGWVILVVYFGYYYVPFIMNFMSTSYWHLLHPIAYYICLIIYGIMFLYTIYETIEKKYGRVLCVILLLILMYYYLEYVVYSILYQFVCIVYYMVYMPLYLLCKFVYFIYAVIFYICCRVVMWVVGTIEDKIKDRVLGKIKKMFSDFLKED